MRFFPKSLTVRVFIGIFLGVVVGVFFPALGSSFKFLADIFISLVKMIITPIVFFTFVIGIGNIDSMKQLGSVGVKALLYFEVVTTLALFLGFGVTYVIQPGAGFDITLGKGIDVSRYVTYAAHHGFLDFFISIFPDNIVGAFARGDMLPILVFAIFFGLALSTQNKKTKTIITIFQMFNNVFFVIVKMIMSLSPIAVFGAMAYTIGQFGFQSLLPLSKLVVCGYLTMILFVFFIFGAIARWYGFNIFKILRYIKEEIMLVLGTSCSETALPTLIEKLIKAGCKPSTVGLVIPAGYSFNLDGTSIYLSMSIFFIAQAYGVELSIFQLFSILCIMMITSKGAAAIPGAGFILMASTLSAIPGHPIPIEGIALLLGIDRFMSEARSITNLIGNTLATLVVSKMQGEFVNQGRV